MNLVELQLQDRVEYNHFVASHGGSFLQSWEWGEWQSALGRTVYRFKILDNGNAQIGSIQLIKMPLPFGKYYLYAPYGPVLDTRSLRQEIQNKFPDAVFIRVEPKNHPALWAPLLEKEGMKSGNIQPGKTLIIDLSKTEDQLLAQMHHKTRYNIRLAQKHGVDVQDEFGISIGNGLFTKEAVNLIVETSRRQGYKGYGAEYYQKMIDCLAMHPFLSSRLSPNASEGAWRDPLSVEGMGVKGFLGSDALKPRNDNTIKLHIYKAIYNNRLLASAIMIDFGKTRTFLFGGSSDENKNVMAPYLMHWQAMLDAKAAGLSQYDFWGVETSSGDLPGFVRFKLGFGGQVWEYAGAYDVIVNKMGYTIYSILRKIKRLF